MVWHQRWRTPCAKRPFRSIIAHAKELGLEVNLLTNGYYVDGEILENLAKYNVYTSVSIDGAEKANDSLRGKGSYKAAVAAIQKLSEKGILNGLSMAITNRNLNEADHVVDLAEKYHAQFVWFNHLVPTGRAKHELNLEPTPEQYDVFLNHVYDLTKKEYKVKFDFNIHCPHYIRVVRDRDPEGFCEWVKQRNPHRQMHLLLVWRLSLVF